jgi:hypothetical protein
MQGEHWGSDLMYGLEFSRSRGTVIGDSSASKVPIADHILKVNANPNRNEIFTLKRNLAKLYF